jgi:nicotinamide-nucleotide amidase
MADAKQLVDLLTKGTITLGSVESFTGGLFGKTITDVAGASKVYKGGIITYGVELKKELLGLSDAFIEKYGVVSPAVAERLAINGLKVLKVDACVSFTGNAGPSVCEDGTSVGETYMAIAYGGQVRSIPLRLDNISREEVRKKSVDAIIDALTSILAKR